MAGRVNTKDAVKNRQQQAGGVMYDGQPAGDDLFGDAEERVWRYTATGLELQRDLTREEFRGRLLPEIETLQSRYQLIVGDAANHGLEHGHIASYEDMAELTGYTAGSIKVFASVCRNIPQLTRVNSLSFKHYQVIAPLPEDEHPHWINFAAHHGLGYRAIETLIQWTEQNPQLPAEVSPDDIEDDEPPSPSEEKEPLIIVHNSPLKAKENRQRFNYLWKKVEHDEPLTSEDLGEVYLHRAWCDMLIEREKHKK